MASTIAVPGTVVPSGSLTTPGGARGIPGASASPSTTAFTVPTVGSTTSVTLSDASWVVVGEMIYFDTAGGGTGLAGILQVTAKAGNTLTLLNPVPAPAIPLASSSADGLLKMVSGFATDYVGGDNSCHGMSLFMPTGAIIDFAGSTAPTGFLLCDGSVYPTGTYPALYNVIGYTYGGSGLNFNVPDCRGRTAIGAGQGTGLTNRALGASISNEETHALIIAELAVHNHTAAALSAHTHTDSGHTHGLNAGRNGGGAGTHWAATGTTAGSSALIDNSGLTPFSANITTASAAISSVSAGTPSINNTGSGTAHNNMQPSIVLNKIIKT